MFESTGLGATKITGHGSIHSTRTDPPSPQRTSLGRFAPAASRSHAPPASPQGCYTSYPSPLPRPPFLSIALARCPSPCPSSSSLAADSAQHARRLCSQRTLVLSQTHARMHARPTHSIRPSPCGKSPAPVPAASTPPHRQSRAMRPWSRSSAPRCTSSSRSGTCPRPTRAAISIVPAQAGRAAKTARYMILIRQSCN